MVSHYNNDVNDTKWKSVKKKNSDFKILIFFSAKFDRTEGLLRIPYRSH